MSRSTSRAGSRTSRRSTPTIRTPRAPKPRPRRSAGRRAQPKGALDGVPVTVKENIATKGVPVPLGTAAMPLTPAAQDAPPPARLREAGAIIFSKTTMPDYGMLSSGVSSFPSAHAQSLGPRRRIPAARAPARARRARPATARCMSAPTSAARCACRPAGAASVGLKPSLGRIPIDPPYVARCAGPMTRTVDDTALMMSVLSKPDHRDGMSLPVQDIDWIEPVGRPEGHAHRPAARCRRRHGGRARGQGRGRGGGEMVRGSGRDRRAGRAADDARDPATGSTRSSACAPGAISSRCRAEQRAKIHPYTLKWAEGGAKLSGVDGDPRLQSDHGAAPRSPRCCSARSTT